MTQRRNKIYFLSILLIFASCTLGFGQGCPTIEIVTPAGLVTAGDTFTVHTNIKSHVGVANLRYSWTTSLGTIVQGQGSAAVVVQTTKEDAGANISIKVSIEGFSSVCQNTATEIVSVAPIIGCGLPADEFTNPSAQDVRARVDNIFIQLQNNPEFVVLFTMSFDNDESRQKRILRIKRILDAIKSRKYDADKVIFLISNESGNNTTVRLLPLTTDMSDFVTQGMIIYGKDMRQKIPTLFQDIK